MTDLLFKTTITFLEPRRVTGYLKAKTVDDAKAQLTDASTKENMLDFTIESIEELPRSEIKFPEATEIPYDGNYDDEDEYDNDNDETDDSDDELDAQSAKVLN